MTLNLESRKWEEFFIGGNKGIFEISSSSSSIDKNKLELTSDEEEAIVPYITRTDACNGIKMFIPNKQNTKYKLDEGGVIIIGLDTQTIFFQPHKFFTGQNIQVLRHSNLNKWTAFFLITLLKVQMKKFNWGGNGATLGRLFKTKIMLPINNSGQLDWEFMENHTKELMLKKNSEYIAYCRVELAKLKCRNIEDIDDKRWHEFFIEDIADIVSGKDIYETERFSGNKPYISSTAQNNGIGHYVGNENSTSEKNCLSVNRNGSVGYAFYHPYEGLYSNDCRKLRPKNSSRHIGLFLANQITRQREKYNYGYKMGTARLKRQKIMLPVTDTVQPDYEFMVQYMINLECKKRKQYIEYLKSQSVDD
jgi:hypothetical protein